MPLAVRTINSDDLELICRHREAMFRDDGQEPSVLAPMTAHFREWLKPRLADGSYFGFMLVDGEPVVAGIDWPPHPSHPTQDWRGYVLNLFVASSHRRQGLGHRLMQLAEAEFAARDVAFAILHATAKRRQLYSKIGWNATAEMAKPLAV